MPAHSEPLAFRTSKSRQQALNRTIMKAEEITVRVTPEAARIYRNASEQERRKLDLLVSLRLTETTSTRRALAEVIREVSEEAQARGLTPEILKEILAEP